MGSARRLLWWRFPGLPVAAPRGLARRWSSRDGCPVRADDLVRYLTTKSAACPLPDAVRLRWRIAGINGSRACRPRWRAPDRVVARPFGHNLCKLARIPYQSWKWMGEVFSCGRIGDDDAVAGVMPAAACRGGVESARAAMASRCPGQGGRVFDGLLLLGGEDPAGPARSRLALRYYRAQRARNQRAPRLIVSGGNMTACEGRTWIEADAMSRFLLGEGVDAADVLVERYARDTFGNLILGVELARAAGVRRLALVTDGFHGWRCRKLFRRIYGAPCVAMLCTDSHGSWEARLREKAAYLALLADLCAAGVAAGDATRHREFLRTHHPLYGAEPAFSLVRAALYVARCAGLGPQGDARPGRL